MTKKKKKKRVGQVAVPIFLPHFTKKKNHAVHANTGQAAFEYIRRKKVTTVSFLQRLLLVCLKSEIKDVQSKKQKRRV